jgi:hypothetical protein
MLKNVMKRTARPWTTNPYLPIQNGPGLTVRLAFRRCPTIGTAYDTLVRIIKEPAKSLNAVLLPRGMHPRAVHRTPTPVSSRTENFDLITYHTEP